MIKKFDAMRVRTKLLLSGLVTFLLVLSAAAVSWFGAAEVDRAGIVALRFANDATILQTLIKDINQLVLTEGAKAVRTRMQDTVKKLDAKFRADDQDLRNTREAAAKLETVWQQARTGVIALTEAKDISVNNDEILGKVVQTIARLDGLGGDVNALAEKARSDGSATAKRVSLFVGSMFAAILVFIAVIFALLERSLRRQLGTEPESVSRIVHRVSGGDLLVKIDAGRRGFNAKSLLGATQNMIERLTNVVRSIDDTNRQIAQSAFQIATMSREMAESNSDQQTKANEVQQATTELTGISATVRALSENAKARTATTEAQASEGLLAVSENIEGMRKTVDEVNVAEKELQALGQAAEQINRIIETIAGIASQTNLLSLNAAIEAARAGEQGRGFAVVADEVRKLANRTSDATREITLIVTTLTEQISRTGGKMSSLVDSARTANEKSVAAGQAIERMVENVRQNDQANLQISAASQTQTQRLDVLGQTLKTLFDTLQDSHTKVAVTTQISEGLYRTVEAVNRQMAYFQYDRVHKPHPAQHEKRHEPRVSNSLLVTVEAGGSQHPMVANDFSLGGMRLQSAESLDLSADQQVRLSIMRPYETLEDYNHQTPLKLKGRIAWAHNNDSGSECGVEFVGMTPSEQATMSECFAFFRTDTTFSS